MSHGNNLNIKLYSLIIRRNDIAGCRIIMRTNTRITIAPNFDHGRKARCIVCARACQKSTQHQRANCRFATDRQVTAFAPEHFSNFRPLPPTPPPPLPTLSCDQPSRLRSVTPSFGYPRARSCVTTGPTLLQHWWQISCSIRFRPFAGFYRHMRCYKKYIMLPSELYWTFYL